MKFRLKTVSKKCQSPLYNQLLMTCYSLVNHLYPSFLLEKGLVRPCKRSTYKWSRGLSIRRLRVRVPSASFVDFRASKFLCLRALFVGTSKYLRGFAHIKNSFPLIDGLCLLPHYNQLCKSCL